MPEERMQTSHINKIKANLGNSNGCICIIFFLLCFIAECSFEFDTLLTIFFWVKSIKFENGLVVLIFKKHTSDISWNQRSVELSRQETEQTSYFPSMKLKKNRSFPTNRCHLTVK